MRFLGWRSASRCWARNRLNLWMAVRNTNNAKGHEMHENLSRPSCPFVSFVIHNSPRNARCSSVWKRCSAWRWASHCWARNHAQPQTWGVYSD